MDKPVIYCAGPWFCPEEKDGLLELAHLLEKDGYATYVPFRDGLDGLWLHDGNLSKDLVRVIYALEVFQVMERCRALVFSLNGRCLDENSVFKASLAFAAGHPVILSKQDNRSAFHGNDNSMVTGLSKTFCNVTRRNRIAGELARLLAEGSPRAVLDAQAGTTCRVGHAIWDALRADPALKSLDGLSKLEGIAGSGEGPDVK